MNTYCPCLEPPLQMQLPEVAPRGLSIPVMVSTEGPAGGPGAEASRQAERGGLSDLLSLRLPEAAGKSQVAKSTATSVVAEAKT